eukprot:1429896-Rhodomonas_salina.2
MPSRPTSRYSRGYSVVMVWPRCGHVEATHGHVVVTRTRDGHVVVTLEPRCGQITVTSGPR